MPRLSKHITFFTLAAFFHLGILAQEPQQDRHFDEDFKSRYTSDKFNYQGDTDVKHNLKTNDGEFAEYDTQKPKEKEENNLTTGTFSSGPLNLIFILILIAAVVFVIYNVMTDGQSSLFSRGKFRKIKSKEITVDNIEESNVDDLIKSAEAQGDYRLAIRYHYLLVLKTLSLKKVIKYEDDKTDSDYLQEIGSATYSNSFAKSAYLYNYVWYGEFPLNIHQYDKAKSSFETLLKTVS